MNQEEFEAFAASLNERWPGTGDALTAAPQVSVRFNRAKASRAQTDLSVEEAPVAWCDRGRYLTERPDFTHDPALHQGLYYVQDASSMAVGAVAGWLATKLEVATNGLTRRPLVYLDACAAPGGKTTAAIDALPSDAVVFANEFDFRRASVLSENVAKWGSERVVVTRGDTARYSSLREAFDIIAVDAPCSGEGMMRKDPGAVAQYSPRLVDECASTQREILANLWPALRPGGYLIYSTCTFNDIENEQVVARLIAERAARPVEVPLLSGGLGGVTVDILRSQLPDGRAAEVFFYRFLPGRVRGEGLCLTVLQKPADESAGGFMAVEAAGARALRSEPRLPSRRSRKDKAASGHRQAASYGSAAGGRSAGHGAAAEPAWLSRALPGDYRQRVVGDSLRMVPADMALITDGMLDGLDVVAEGIEAAVLKGRDYLPAQPLALARGLDASAFPQAEVDRTVALDYLRRQAVTIDAPKGIVLLTYGGRPLGFVKNLGNRANNLYPAPWRILK